MTTPLLQVTGIEKSFGAVRALRGVSFAVEAGQVHALVGENGAGKSTLIKVMTGAYRPDAGAIAFAGRPVAHWNPASARSRGIAAIYQQPALFPDLTVAENIALGREQPRAFRRVRWAERRQFARDVLNRIGARIDPDLEVNRLSMPQQQLVEIARALGAGARMIIMDEPTASLTQEDVDLLLRVVRDLRNQKVAIVYISHRLHEIFGLADQVTVLRDGESVGSFRTDELSETELIRLMVGRDVSAIYPSAAGQARSQVLALDSIACEPAGIHHISFGVHAGEVVGLAGLVGAGRTELARTIFGITPATSGSMRLNGRVVAVRSPRDAIALGIGYVPEDRRRHGVILDMPIGSNVTLATHERYFPWGWLRLGLERRLASDQMLALDIRAPDPDTCVSALSGGNQQKVALARWLVADPKLLILDEPTQGVDVGAKVEIHKLIRNLADGGLAVLMISSDLPEVLGMSDRIIVMRSGTVAGSFDRAGANAQDVIAAALGQRTGPNAA